MSTPTQPTNNRNQRIAVVLDQLVNYVGGNDTAKEFTVKEAQAQLAKLMDEEVRHLLAEILEHGVKAGVPVSALQQKLDQLTAKDGGEK